MPGRADPPGVPDEWPARRSLRAGDAGKGEAPLERERDRERMTDEDSSREHAVARTHRAVPTVVIKEKSKSKRSLSDCTFYVVHKSTWCPLCSRLFVGHFGTEPIGKTSMLLQGLRTAFCIYLHNEGESDRLIIIYSVRLAQRCRPVALSPCDYQGAML